MSTVGSDPGISTLHNDNIKITAKAQFTDSCCIGPRTYFYVLENAIEWNLPFYCGCLFPNFFCKDFDSVGKMYFDRGLWDMRSCLYQIGFFKGPATFYSHNPKHVCICVDCPDCYNSWQACYWPSCCGDRLYYTPYDSCCCGLCSSRATCCTNCCGLCGPKTGEPVLAFNFIKGLVPGSGEALSVAVNNSRHTWSERTLKA